MSNFEMHIKNILDGNVTVSGSKKEKGTVKIANNMGNNNITVESLRKIATILRDTNPEPTYSDLAKFVTRIL